MIVLYKFFKTWFDHYKSKNSNETSTSLTLTIISLEVALLIVNLLIVYKHLIIGEIHVFKDKMDNKFPLILLLIGYYFISRHILKRVITKYFLFDIEKGESSKYFYESTKKTRNIYRFTFWMLLALPAILLYIIRKLQG